jgi:hypothetical protein
MEPVYVYRMDCRTKAEIPLGTLFERRKEERGDNFAGPARGGPWKWIAAAEPGGASAIVPTPGWPGMYGIAAGRRKGSAGGRNWQKNSDFRKRQPPLSSSPR